jgi:hypothetical protein
VAIVSNLRSERNRSVNGAAVRTVLARRRLCAYAELNDFGELPGIVDRFRTAGIDHIVVDGGDGTIQALLTELMANRCDRRFRPRLAILPSGMTNLIAADVGVKGCGAAALERVLDALENCRETVLSRPTLRLDLVDSVDGMVRRSLSGMFFGAAALHHGAEFARDRVHAHGIKHAAGVAFTIAGIAWRSLLPRRPDFFLGDEIAVSVDEGPVDLRPRFLFIATTLERLVLGLWPFWDLGSGGLRYFDVPAPPPRLLTSMARVLAQRPSPTMARAGYRSGRAERLSLALRAPCMLDGEVVQPGPDEAVALSVGPVVDFVRV